MRLRRRASVVATLALGILFAAGRPAAAIPLLQLYLEGAEYNTDLESWVLIPQDSSSGEPFRVWAIGNTTTPQGTIYEVRMAIAYEATDDITITLNPVDTDYWGWEVSTPYPGQNALLTGTTWTDGSAPELHGDVGSRTLPSHGLYGEGIYWQEFELGNFERDDAWIANFDETFVGDWEGEWGQVNVYEITVTGGSGLPLHFDLYNHVPAGNSGKYRSVFAPFSHNAQIIPAPATLVGFIGLLPMLLWRRLK